MGVKEQEDDKSYEKQQDAIYLDIIGKISNKGGKKGNWMGIVIDGGWMSSVGKRVREGNELGEASDAVVAIGI